MVSSINRSPINHSPIHQSPIKMWFKIKTYLKFLFRSFHLHGVHSPFVFQLQQACFSEKENLLTRLVGYLKIESILVFGKTTKNDFFKNQETASVNFGNSKKLSIFLRKNKKFDLIYFAFSTENLYALFQKSLPMVHNDSVFVFEKIHRSKEMELVWEKIKQSENVRVSIDIFHFGFVFFRKEQAKENFVVRLG